MPIDQRGRELHKLVRQAGLKIDSSAGKALATDIAILKDAYAYVRDHRHERAKRILKPFSDIARHAAAVAKNLDQMKAFQAMVKAIEDIAERASPYGRNGLS